MRPNHQAIRNVGNMAIWKKKYKPQFKNKIIFLNFKEYLGLNIFLHFFTILTLSWRRMLSYRNQFIDLQTKSMDWFLYDKGFRNERVKRNLKKNICKASNILKNRIYWITKSIFNRSHFVKCQLVFNFKRQVQAHYDYNSLYLYVSFKCVRKLWCYFLKSN